MTAERSRHSNPVILPVRPGQEGDFERAFATFLDGSGDPGRNASRFAAAAGDLAVSNSHDPTESCCTCSELAHLTSGKDDCVTGLEWMVDLADPNARRPSGDRPDDLSRE